MGRPLKKGLLGNPSNTGKQLVLAYVWLEDSTTPETGYWATKQTGTVRYEVTNGTKTGIIKLVDHTPTQPGEGTIEISIFGSTDRQYAKKINNRTITTFSGNTYSWSINPAELSNQANLPFEDYVTQNVENSLISSANEATSEEIIQLIDDNKFELLDNDDIEKYDAVYTGGGGRYAAIGDGVVTWKTLFGNFQSLASLKSIIKLNVITEYYKHQLIVACDAATTATKLDKAIKKWIPVVYEDRIATIDMLEEKQNSNATLLADYLKTESMTVSFKALIEFINTTSSTKSFSTALLARRNAYSNHQFNGITRIVESVNATLSEQGE
jgi:hypothetical protein